MIHAAHGRLTVYVYVFHFIFGNFVTLGEGGRYPHKS
jgi:hypothetical protein